MEGASGTGSSWLAATKSKLLLLSSVLGIGTIIYFTKNYLEYGHVYPQTTSQKKSDAKLPKVIGGKHSVVIREDLTAKDGITKKVLNKQRSRQSSVCSSRSRRRSSILSTSKRRRDFSISKESIDKNLNIAIDELSDSVKEMEEMLGLKNINNKSNHVNQSENNNSNNKFGNHIIEGEIKKIRKLIDFAQDVDLVADRTTEYVLNHQKNEEDIVGGDVEPELLEENIEMLYNSVLDDDYDSDNDSFISATESVDLEISDEEEYESATAFSMKVKDLIKKHCKDDLYMQGIEYLTQYGVPVRSIHTDMLNCDNDVDFCVKVHCLRGAFNNILKVDENRKWFMESGKEMLGTLLERANYDREKFSKDYDEMMKYCRDPDNWSDIEVELSGRGVCTLSFYDIVLDLLIMDSFEDLNNPPSAVTSAIQNTWLSLRIKETALSTAIWTVLKAKKHRLGNQNGFFARFYDMSMYLTPVLAWGFLGPVKELNNLCSKFKDTMVNFLKDIFSVESANYKTVEMLAEDVFNLAKKRKEELMTAITS